MELEPPGEGTKKRGEARTAAMSGDGESAEDKEREEEEQRELEEERESEVRE